MINIMRNRVYILLVLALSALYFIITGLQYWMSQYLVVVMEIDEVEVYWFYSITTFTAPFIGVAAGGICFHYLGGYNAPKSLLLLTITGFIAMAVAIPIPFLYHKWTVYILLWWLLFFGAFMLPTITGMMLNSVHEDNRATANAIAVLLYNICGYLPAPYLYGKISTLGIDIETKFNADLVKY